MTSTLEQRRAAIRAWDAASDGASKMGEAASAFRALYGDAIKNVPAFIKYWVDRLENTGSLKNLPHPGRPPVIPFKVALECCDLLLGGMEVEGRQHYFSSFLEALRELARLREVVEHYDVHPKSLLRRMHQVSGVLAGPGGGGGGGAGAPPAEKRPRNRASCV